MFSMYYETETMIATLARVVPGSWHLLIIGYYWLIALCRYVGVRGMAIPVGVPWE